VDPRDRTLLSDGRVGSSTGGESGEDISLARTAGGSSPKFTAQSEEIGHGQLVGRYVVLNALGAGGMGVVYAAYDPQLDRKVALKLLHSETVSRSGGTQSFNDGHARLLREAQAMARLRHPNVVSVHDVGTVGDRVFIAMEFVEGSTLKSWLRARPRTRKEVLAVFQQAGRGLQAAHVAGLVHRDFKPENVLVSHDDQVQVLDFGLAKATEDEAEDHRGELDMIASARSLNRELTQQGSVLGTPAYMSPEQHMGMATDARTDQFSFCVALYEALYGTPPFPADSMATLALAVVGGKVAEAPRESHERVPLWLRKVLLRGLASEPANRFPSMAALLDELGRDPGGKRRRWLAIGAGVTVLALAAGGYAQYLAQSQGRCDDAEQDLVGVWDEPTRQAAHSAFLAASDGAFAEDTWQRVATTLDRYSGAWVQMQAAVCTATYIEQAQSVELLHLQGACLARRLSELRAVSEVFTHADAAVVERAVSTVAGLSDLRSCTDEASLTSSVVLPPDVQSRAAVDGVRVKLDSAKALERAGKYGLGLQTAASATEQARGLDYAPLLAEALLIEAGLRFQSGSTREAETATAEAISVAAEGKHASVAAEAWVQLIALVGVEQAHHERALNLRLAAEAAITWAGGDPRMRAQLLAVIGRVLHSQARFAEAIATTSEALAIYEKLPDDAETHARALAIADALASLGTAHHSKGEFEAADAYFQRALTIRRQILGSDHPAASGSLHDLGNTAYARGRYDEAARYLNEALAIRVRVLGGQHPKVADTENSLGAVDYAQGEFGRARDHYDRALKIREATLGPEHPNTAATLINLGNTALVLGDHATAREHYARALQIQEKALGPNHPNVAYSLTNLGLVLLNEDRAAESLPYYERALQIREQAFGLENPDVAHNLDDLGEIQAELGNLTAAFAYQLRALQIREKTLGLEHPLVARSLYNLGQTLTRLRRFPEAHERLAAALKLREQTLGANHPDVAQCLVAQVNLELAAGEDAVPAAERALQIRSSAEGVKEDVHEAQLLLARALLTRKPIDRVRARELAIAARDGYASLDPTTFKAQTAEAQALLAKLR
jgi:tetratricopeptide (TPR) repeat protein/predicted Ser/Thr protein kinase